MLRKIPILLIAVFAGLVLFAGVASAQTFKTGSNTTVAGTEVINSAAYLSGNTVDVAGTVNGDLYCAGQTVNISGTVNGDVFCAGQTVTFSGTVSGSIRLAGQTVITSGKAASATIMAQTVTLADNTNITQDLNGGASTITIAKQAVVGRDIAYGAATMVVNGTVGRDIKTDVEQLTLGGGATVGGNIAYTSVNAIAKAPDATVSGTVNQTVPKEQANKSFSFGIASSLFFAMYLFVAVLLILIVLVLLFPGVYKESAARVGNSPWVTLLIGFIAVIAAPIVLISIAITIIGIPLALTLGLMWLVIVMLSGSFSAFYVGSLLLKEKGPLLTMLSGGALLMVLYLLPILGFFVAVIATMLGVGIILRELMRRAPKTKNL